MHRRIEWIILCLLLAGQSYAQQTEPVLRQQIEQAAALTDEEEAWKALQKLIKLPASGRDRLELMDLYVNRGFRYVQKKMDMGSTDFAELHDVNSQLWSYAVKKERREIRNAEAYLARAEASWYSKRSAWDSTYLCLTKAYDGYTSVNAQSQQAKILNDIQQVEQIFISVLEKEACARGRSSDKTSFGKKPLEFTPQEIGAVLLDAVRDDSLNRTPIALLKFLIVKKQTHRLANEGEWRIHFVGMVRAADCYRRLKRYREAWDECQELLSLPLTEVEMEKAESTSFKCGSLLASALLHADEPEYQEARAILERILPFADKGEESEILDMMAQTWLMEGVDNFSEMRQEEAALCYRNALQKYSESGNVSQQAVVLLHLSETEISAGRTKEAARLLSQAETMARQIGAQSLQADVIRMQLLLTRSRDDRDAYADRVYAWDTLADSAFTQRLYCEWGDRMVAQKNYEMAKYYYEKSLSASSPLSRDVLLSVYYDKMCNMYVEAGDYARAEPYGRQSIAMGALTRYTDWIRQGVIYAGLNKRKDFEACYDHLQELVATENSGPREQVLIYTSRALGYTFFKEWKQAYEDLQAADGILKTHYGDKDSGRLNVLSLMGAVLSKQRQLDEVCRVYHTCADLARDCWGENSVVYSKALEKLAMAEQMCEQTEQVRVCYAQSMTALQGFVKSQLRYVSSTERESFWNQNSEKLWNMSAYAVYLDARNDAFTEACYNAVLFSKGLLLESEKSLNQILRQEGTLKDQKIFREITDLQNRITDLKRHEGFSQDTLAMWQTQMQKLDHELAVRSKAYADYTDFLDWDYRKVQRCLKKNEVLIDFVDYTSLYGTGQYAAYLIRKDQPYPLLLRMFTRKDLDDLMQKGPLDRLYYAEASERVLNLLWKQIGHYVSEGETVYYVPSGQIHQLSLEALPMSDGTLLGDHYPFVRLSSARELLRRTPSVSGARTAVLYGGLQYDLTADEMQEESRKYSLPPLLATRGGLRGDSVFSFLPESGEEVRQIASVLQENQYQVTVCGGASGSEESFLSLSGHSPCLLHLATHGFYYTPSEALHYSYLSGLQDAMYLSGLVLSGGNAVWQGKQLPEGVLGGVLTAHDIAALDLSSTDLAVLSACQSGQGEVTAEGLYGLQRAFKKAGVQTLIMTLWRVSDRVTREFMVAFYQSLIRENGDKRKAFEEARAQIRARYPEPFYWAGFVIID